MALTYKTLCPYGADLENLSEWSFISNNGNLLLTTLRKGQKHYLVLYNQFTDAWLAPVILDSAARRIQPVTFVQPTVVILMEVTPRQDGLAVNFVLFKLDELLRAATRDVVYTKVFPAHAGLDLTYLHYVNAFHEREDHHWTLTIYDNRVNGLNIYTFPPPLNEELWAREEFVLRFQERVDLPEQQMCIAYSNRRVLVANGFVDWAMKYWVFDIDGDKVVSCENDSFNSVPLKVVGDTMQSDKFVVFRKGLSQLAVVDLQGTKGQYPYVMVDMPIVTSNTTMLPNGQLLQLQQLTNEDQPPIYVMWSVWLKPAKASDSAVHWIRSHMSEEKKEKIRWKLPPNASYKQFILSIVGQMG